MKSEFGLLGLGSCMRESEIIFIHEFLCSKENNNIAYTTCFQREKYEGSVPKLLAACVLLPAIWVLKRGGGCEASGERTQTQCLGWQGRKHWAHTASQASIVLTQSTRPVIC